MLYEKIYTRENCLLAYELWEEHQTKSIIDDYGWAAQSAIFNVTENSAEVYYTQNLLADYEKVIAEKIKSDKRFIPQCMRQFAEALELLEKIWRDKQPLSTIEAVDDFYKKSMQCWKGVDMAYIVPSIEFASEKDKKLAMEMRQHSVDFLENTDKIFQLTLRKLFPELGDLVKYITLEEIKGKIPEKSELQERSKHYIYFINKIYTNINFIEFAKQENLNITEDKIINTNEVKGQVAMKGKVRGKVRVIILKKNIPDVEPGEILVTTMTTPDYLPAMYKARAFVTDEGGITCHAAIVAREIGKPCVISTKIATRIFKTGDLVEVDADSGIIKKINK